MLARLLGSFGSPTLERMILLLHIALWPTLVADFRMAAQGQGYRGVHHQAATLIESPPWRSVHLAAPPLSGDHTPQQLAALAPAAPGNTATRLEYYAAFVRTLEELCAEVTRRLEAENRDCSHEDRVWLSTRLAALSRRFRGSIPLQAPDDARRDTAVRVAVERITARLRCDVERYPSAPNFQDTIEEFVVATLEHFVTLMDNGTWDDHLVVSLLTPAFCGSDD